MIEYNKLVRDNIPEIIKGDGKNPVTHIASDSEYQEKLIQKLQEEVDEYKKDQNPEELADILEVIDALSESAGINNSELLKLKEKKTQENGGFKKRIILERVD